MFQSKGSLVQALQILRNSDRQSPRQRQKICRSSGLPQSRLPFDNQIDLKDLTPSNRYCGSAARYTYRDSTIVHGCVIICPKIQPSNFLILSSLGLPGCRLPVTTSIIPNRPTTASKASS